MAIWAQFAMEIQTNRNIRLSVLGASCGYYCRCCAVLGNQAVLVPKNRVSNPALVLRIFTFSPSYDVTSLSVHAIASLSWTYWCLTAYRRHYGNWEPRVWVFKHLPRMNPFGSIISMTSNDLNGAKDRQNQSLMSIYDAPTFSYALSQGPKWAWPNQTWSNTHNKQCLNTLNPFINHPNW